MDYPRFAWPGYPVISAKNKARLSKFSSKCDSPFSVDFGVELLSGRLARMAKKDLRSF